MSGADLNQAFTTAFEHHRAGRLTEAEALYRQILAAQPDNADVLHALGIVAHQTCRHAEAVDWLQQAIARAPQNAPAHSHLGEAYRATGRLDEALVAYRRAVELQPDLPEAWNNLGNALRDKGELNHAVTAYRRAVRLKPDFAMAHHNLGLALAQQRNFPEAITAYRRALQVHAEFAEARYNLSAALAENGETDEAMAAYRAAGAQHPGHPDAHNNLAVALVRQGQLDDAIAVFRRSLELRPDDADVHSNLIHALHLHPRSDEHLIASEQQRWNQRFSAPLRAPWRPHGNDRNPDRRLRIGYISRDFCSHPVAFFVAPVLEAHSRQQFEVFCYADVPQPDAVTERLRQGADIWRDVRALSHAQLADVVRGDAVDILVDLGMHTGGNRLPVFARQPAPVQVSWLAYPGSTGLDTIDFRLSDARLDPEGEDDSGAGGAIVRLPDCWCCYMPIEDFPAVSPLPAIANGTVTFGSLNQYCKISDDLLASWASILIRVPGSRLRMICPEGQARERVLAQFTMRGVARERVEWITPCPWPEYVRLFEGIDLALDSFPCNGLTTTCHALWTGLPVVTRAGSRPVSRAGSSVLHAAGLPEWVARSEEEYVKIAADLAGNLSRLAETRRTLRPRLQSSVLMDAARFTRNLEAAFRTRWQGWCSAK